MANVLKQQESLDSAFKKRSGLGLVCVFGGGIILLFLTKVAVIGVILIAIGVVLIGEGHKFQVGAVGESRVAEVLTSFPDNWYIFNDINVGRSQIDHIVVCPKGVYTIETKNYRGTIYGNAKNQDWSQVINYGYKTKFYNPVKQGNGHSVALSKYLEENGFNKIWINTIVIFTKPRVKLKVYSPEVPVIYLSDLSEYFNEQKQVMSPSQCNKIAMCVSKLIPA
jgi:hypothetical protein